MSVNIIKQLKSLKEIAPRAEWKEANRDFLMSEIKNNLAGKQQNETWASEISSILFPWKVMRLAVRPVMTLVAIFGLVLGSGFSVSASQLALPGDRLYPLKIATEKVQVAFTFDDKEAAKMHVKLAGKRINEVRVIKGNTDSQQNKIQKINVAMDKFQQEIAAVQNNLDNLNNEVAPQATVEVAKIVDSKVKEYKETLSQTTTDLPVDGEAAEKISKGLDLAEETSDKALAVIVEKHVQGEVVQSEEDVLKRVEQKIETTEAKVAEVEGQMDNLSAPQIEQLRQATVGVKEVLAQAREALNQKDMTIALSKTMESKELAKQAEQIATEAVSTVATEDSVSCEGCDTNSGTNQNINADLTNSPIDGINTDTNSAINTNTNTPKVYIKPVIKVVAPAPPAEPEIDESALKVGIDLRQEETKE